MNISNISFIIFLQLLIYILLEETEVKPYCSLNTDCDKCNLCDKYSECGFSNILCKEPNSTNYNLTEELHTNLTIYYKNDVNIASFCNSRNITLNNARDSFTIFKSNPNTLSGMLDKTYHCEYYIYNPYYHLHETDEAILNIGIKNKDGKRVRNSKLEFSLIYLYNSNNKWQFSQLTEKNFKNELFSRSLSKVLEFEILIDFNNNNTDFENDEYLIISIETDNPSKKLRIIYIVIIVLVCFFFLVVIGLIILYFILKKKLIQERERNIREEKELREKTIQKVELFLQNELKPLTFINELNIHGCDSCSICCDSFIIGTSQVSITPCLHIFHHECLEKWIKEKITAPNCPNCMHSFLDFIDNPTKIQIGKKVIYPNNDKTENKDNSKEPVQGVIHDIRNVNDNNELAISEQLRINDIQDNKENNNEDNINNDKSVHLSIHENDNNEV